MKRFSFSVFKEIPDDIINEIIILHSIGVSIEDLKYLLELRLSEY